MNDRSPPPIAGEPGTPEAPVLFQAFKRRKSRAGRWTLLALLVAGLAIWGIARSTGGPRQGPAPTHGIESVHPGMTSQEVSGILGSPFAVQTSSDGRAKCYQYGHPTLDRPEFPVYSLCYESGRLRDMKIRRFTTMPVGSEGQPSPPGAEQPGK